MTNIYDPMFFDYNFRGQPYGPVSGSVPGITLSQDVNGNWIITYTIFDDPSDLDSTHYDNYEEETDFASGGDYLQYVEDAFLDVLSYSTAWSASFMDVAKISFQADTSGDPGHITIGQLTDDFSIFQSTPGASAYALGYPNFTIAHHGDIWVNVDHASSDYSGANMWDVDGGSSDPIVAGEFMWTVIHEEIAHALGIDIMNTSLESTSYNSEKYSVTSYNDGLPGMYDTSNYGVGAYAPGLQLFDIAAIQAIYGIDWDTRSGSTVYDDSGAFSGTGATNDAFIYTIWDGGGDDTISADGFYESGAGAGASTGAVIDLRQGAFSSIGSSVVAARATDNVAIAFHAIIENAEGSVKGDVLIGNAWDNILEGGDGNDEIYSDGIVYDGYVGFGAASNEHDPNNGDDEAPDADVDQLYGGAGNDTFYGNKGSDTIYGGANSDTVYYTRAPVFIRATVDDASLGNYTVEKWYVGSDPGSDPADAEDTLYSIETFIDKHAALAAGFSAGSYGGTAINGTNAGEGLSNTGGSAATINGMGGNDTLTGNNSYDDYLLGGAGNDTLNGGNGDNRLDGGGDNDYLYGGLGDDWLDGGAGNDYLEGGHGNDLFVYSGGDDIFVGGGTGASPGDTDTAELSGVAFSSITFSQNISTGAVLLSISGGGSISLQGQNNGHGIDILELSDGTYYMRDIVAPLFGTGSGDYIVGSYTYLGGGVHSYHGASIDDLIYGYGGGDSIYASHGNNTVYGGTGNDNIYGGNDSDLFYGEANDDWLYGYNGNDFLYGDGGTDNIYGGSGADALFGGDGADTLYGENDNDWLDGGAGNDTVYGGDGADTYFYSAGNDLFTENSGYDIIEFDTGIDLGDLSYSQSGSDLVIGVSGAGQVTVQYYYYSSAYHIEGLKFADGSTASLAAELV